MSFLTEAFHKVIAVLYLGQNQRFTKSYGQTFSEHWAFGSPQDTPLILSYWSIVYFE